MLNVIITILLIVVAVVIALAARKPNHFSVSRVALINVNATELFPFINNLKAFRQWSPWEGQDPAMTAIHSGEASGQGAIYEWNGNKKVGQGRMEIRSTEINKQVIIKIDFIRPFVAHNTVEFLLTPELKKTRIEWKMHGPNVFMSKVMQVFISMDKMVGPDFEQGLNNLQTLIEHNNDHPIP